MLCLQKKYNHRLNSLAVFCRVRRHVGAQKYLSALCHPHKTDPVFNHRLYNYMYLFIV